MRAPPLLLPLLLASPWAMAQTPPSPPLEPGAWACPERPRTADDRAACDTVAVAQEEAAMDQAYRAVFGSLNRADRRLLDASQRAWVADRAAACAPAVLSRRPDDGSLAPRTPQGCHLARTQARVAWLHRALFEAHSPRGWALAGP